QRIAVALLDVVPGVGGLGKIGVELRELAVAAAVEDTSAPSSPNIQVATGSNREGADAVARRLSGADIPSSVEAQGEEGAQVFRVLAGPFETQGAFNAALAKLKELGYEDAFATQ
ncbi:MAG: SPOR domain-containing protein, partial [Pseudomonadota bacterium]